MYRGFATPLEAACFAVLVELVRKSDEKKYSRQHFAESDCRNTTVTNRKNMHAGE